MLPRLYFTIKLESDSNSTIRHRAQSSIELEPQIRVELNLIEFERFGFGTCLVSRREDLHPSIADELTYKKICYFTNWAQYRLVPAKFEPEHIDPFLCTHIIYAFAYISNETFLITKVEENDEGLSSGEQLLNELLPPRSLSTIECLEETESSIEDIARCRGMEHDVPRLLHDGPRLREATAFHFRHHQVELGDRTTRLDRVFSLSSFLHKHQFDGFEADWEYPGIRGGRADDKYYLTLFFQVRETLRRSKRRIVWLSFRNSKKPLTSNRWSRVNPDCYSQLLLLPTRTSLPMVTKSRRFPSRSRSSPQPFISLFFQNLGLHQCDDLVSVVLLPWPVETVDCFQ